MGHHNCCNKQNVKRGLWSPEEDEKLINYITAFGHGCWSTVPRLAGLQRCGKSCRLRWINYLRPDLKRGNFTPQEAALIIELHRILGNKWAQIAKHLPGRTDNEVKNFWNSSIKKKLIAHHKKSDQNSNLIINNQNNNLTEMDIQMITNSQMEKIPTQPPLPPPPPPFHGYTDHTCSIEPGFNQVMNYNPNAVTAAAAAPIPISVDSSLFDLPASWNNQVLKQEDDFMFGSFDETQILDNSFINLKPEMQAYDHDSAMLDALMPELSDMNKMIDQFAPPLPPQPVAAVPSAMKGQQILHDPIGGTLDEGCFVPLHPNHINNIASLMASFAPPPPPSRAVFPPPPPPPPCNHPFRFTRYLPVSHDHQM